MDWGLYFFSRPAFYTILKYRDQEIGEFYVVQEGRAADWEAPKLRKCRSGSRLPYFLSDYDHQDEKPIPEEDSRLGPINYFCLFWKKNIALKWRLTQGKNKKSLSTLFGWSGCRGSGSPKRHETSRPSKIQYLTRITFFRQIYRLSFSFPLLKLKEIEVEFIFQYFPCGTYVYHLTMSSAKQTLLHSPLGPGIYIIWS